MSSLKRTLGLGACIFFGVGSILGAGIYTLIGKVAGESGNMIWLSFLIASITALCTAFSYAELSAAFPKAGGEYEYAKKAFGKKTGTFLGIIISTNGVISGATVALGFAGYLNQLIGLPLFIAALGIIGLIFLVNITGIRQSSTVNIIFTLIEFSGLLLVVYVGLSYVGKIDYSELSDGGIKSLFTGSALAFFAYIGFEEIVKLAEETKNPEKNIPRALFSASIIVIIIYTIVAICVVSVIPYAELAKSKSPLADVVKTALGQTGVIIISVIALFSTSNTILSNMMGSSRVLLNMSKENQFMKRFSTISAKRQTPVAALVLIVIVMGAFAMIGKIETVAMIANIFIFVTFIIVNLCVIVMRIKDKNLNRPYRVPINIKNIPVISVLGILLIMVLFGFNIYSLFT
ncbi:MAG: amino acid permease [Bacteroidota bacterium]|nr:amino acid permease [Bacteroidota bacterium]